MDLNTNFMELYLYKLNMLKDNNNLIIDDISTYLNEQGEFSPITIKYQPLKLYNDFKLIIDGDMSDNLRENFYNYIRLITYHIVKRDIPHKVPLEVYYFIESIEWLSSASCILHCKMDTINSFFPGEAFEFTDKTFIYREHKNRFYIPEGDTPSVYVHREIDRVPEGFNTTPVHYEDSDNVIVDSNKYYIVYKSMEKPEENETKPLQIGIVSQNPYAIHIDTDISNEDFDRELSVYNVIKISGRGTVNLEYDSGELSTQLVQAQDHVIIIVTSDLVRSVTQGLLQKFYMFRWTGTGYSSLLDGGTSRLYVNLQENPAINDKLKVQAKYFENIVLTSQIDMTDSATYNTYGGYFPTLDSINRSDARIMKIVQIPYAPWNDDNEAYTNFYYNPFLKMVVPSNQHDLEGTREVLSSLAKPLYYKVIDYTNYDFSLSANKQIELESKLYHSDFFYMKYIFDSFSYIFKLEDYQDNYDFDDDVTFNINYYYSKNGSSSFFFNFPNWNTKRGGTSDYDLLMVNRNNEVMLYNSAYLDYMRNGYNYDVKSNKRANITSILGLGVQGVGIASQFMSGNYAVGALGSVNFADNIANAIMNANSREDALKQKLNDLDLQGTSIQGADDLELMNKYSNGVLKYRLYQLENNIRNQLFNLFFYKGYASNRYGIPDLESRIRFNYLECDLRMKQIYSFNDEIKEDIIKKYREGVTFIHSLDNGEIDIYQEHENFERAFLEGGYITYE